MKMALISSFAALTALVAVSIAPLRAEAFDTGKSYKMSIINGFQKIDTGKLRAELFQYVDDSGYEACSYFARWSGSQLFFDELVTPGYLDCDLNSTVAFPTLIVNSPGFKSSGVNKFRQGETIQNMILSEHPQGFAVGIITLGTNFPYPLLVEPS